MNHARRGSLTRSAVGNLTRGERIRRAAQPGRTRARIRQVTGPEYVEPCRRADVQGRVEVTIAPVGSDLERALVRRSGAARSATVLGQFTVRFQTALSFAGAGSISFPTMDSVFTWAPAVV